MRRFLSSALLFLLAFLPRTAIFAQTFTVMKGQSIQKAVNEAKAGDVIEISPGVYNEMVVVDTPMITLRGKIVNGEWPVLDGQNKKTDGVIASGAGFHIENLRIINYKGNGVTTQGADHVVMRRLVVENTGIYGLYPTRGTNVLVEDSVVSGISDAGIYIGMCKKVDVRRNEVFKNVAGIEIENSTDVLVEDNVAYNNAGGILVFTLPGLPIKKGENTIVRRNTVSSNNHVNFGAPSSVVGSLPSGSGIIILAGQKVVLEANSIRDNKTAGLLFVDADYIQDSSHPDKEINPRFENNKVLDNFFHNNGYNPVGKVKLILATMHLTLTGPDIGAHGKGGNNCVHEGLTSRFLSIDKTFKKCSRGETTSNVKTMLTERPKSYASYQPPKDVGKHTFEVICAGCHATGGMVLIGPSIEEIQKKYANNAKGIAEFAYAPTKIRSRYPAMPSHAYLGKEKLTLAADYILKLGRIPSGAHEATTNR
jgi:parallel beta-helix repeat protein